MSVTTATGPFTLTAADATMLATVVAADGGFTYSTVTGYVPTEGFAVSIPNFESATTLALGIDYLAREIHRYAARHADTLAFDGLFLGAWYDRATDTVYLDHTLVVDGEPEAARRAVQYQQAAYYVIHTGDEVRVDADAARR